MEHSCFPGVTAYENYQRLALIMREDIGLRIDGDAEELKRRWYDFNRIDDLASESTSILKSYRRFVSSLFPEVLDFDEQTALDNRLLAELSRRRDLTPHDRAAYRLALEYNKEII